MTCVCACQIKFPLNVNACACWIFKSCICKVTSSSLEYKANVLSMYSDNMEVGPFACTYVVRATIMSALSALYV